jgi:hypothetical protein
MFSYSQSSYSQVHEWHGSNKRQKTDVWSGFEQRQGIAWQVANTFHKYLTVVANNLQHYERHLSQLRTTSSPNYLPSTGTIFLWWLPGSLLSGWKEKWYTVNRALGKFNDRWPVSGQCSVDTPLVCVHVTPKTSWNKAVYRQNLSLFCWCPVLFSLFINSIYL